MIANRPLSRDDLPFPLDRPLTGQDLLAVLPRVLDPLWAQASTAVRGNAAQVTAVNNGPPKTVTITADGQTYKARYLATYTPTVGDLVVVLYNASQAIVLGVIA